MRVVPLRLTPGVDLSLTLDQLLRQDGVRAGCVLSGIGSLSAVRLRLAGQDAITTLMGFAELQIRPWPHRGGPGEIR